MKRKKRKEKKRKYENVRKKMEKGEKVFLFPAQQLKSLNLTLK